MSALIDLLEAQAGELVYRWYRCIDDGLSSARPPELLLRDQLAGAVDRLLAALRWEARPERSDAPPSSRREPLSSGLDVGLLVGEYSVLPGLILDLAGEANVGLSLSEVRVLTDFVTASIAEGVAEERQLRVRSEQALRERHRRELAEQHADRKPPLASMRPGEGNPVEQALRASEERYRTLFAAIDDAFCLIELIADDHGQTVDYLFLEANAAFEVQTGLKDAVGKTIRQLAPGISTTWFTIYGKVADTGETLRFENHDPALSRWFDAYANRVGPPEKRQVAIVFKDITARKVSEQERERLVEELARSNRDLDHFAYVASHDLKAPLRGIANLSQWIEDDLGDAVTDDARTKLGLMRVRVQRLEDLINGILSYATAGRSQAKLAEVDVGQLLTEVVGLLAAPAHIAIRVAEPMPTLQAERVLLQQVFMNLIGNAVKHTQQSGASIQVAAADEGGFVHFTVTDNGPGIAPEYHERIWGIFQKLESRAHVEGTGIGLSIVKKIVESRGGKTWVESAEGKGATFHVLWAKRAVADGTA